MTIRELIQKLLQVENLDAPAEVRVTKDRKGTESLESLRFVPVHWVSGIQGFVSIRLTDLEQAEVYEDTTDQTIARKREMVHKQLKFKQQLGIESCTCTIIDPDIPCPTMKFDKTCPVHQPGKLSPEVLKGLK